MIPKIIHYCWFGGKEKPEDVMGCIRSWKQYLPDYKVVEWNEGNFNIDGSNQYVKDAYRCKKWAFVSDYARLHALYEHGGLYFDTDVEVFKNFDPLLEAPCFFGFESKDYVATAVMGCEKNNTLIRSFMQLYHKRSFWKEDGTIDMTTNVVELTNLLKEKGLKGSGKLQVLDDKTVIFPQKYFASNSLKNVFERYDKDIYAYHHCLSSWYDNARGKGKVVLLKHYFVGLLRNMVGTDLLMRIRSNRGGS